MNNIAMLKEGKESMIDIEGRLYTQKREIGWEDYSRDISVSSCGYQKFMTHKLKQLRSLGRVDFQIIYITRGHGNYYIDGKMKRIGEGCIVLYRPHQRQEYYYLPDNTEVYWVHFTGKDAQKHIADMDSGMEIGISNEVSQIFTSIIYALQTRRPMFHEIANALFLQLIYTIKQCAEEFKKGRVDIDIENLILTMQNEYNKKWTLDKMAAACGLSKYRLAHKFKEYMGIAPVQYITKIRMDKSKRLLSESTMPVREIAGVLGYDNALYFSRLFRKHEGMSPTEYRDMFKI
jgi:AraC family transcriptional regulator of arabinose operon